MATTKKFRVKYGLDASNTSIIFVADPTNAKDAATKSYVDTQVSGVQSNLSSNQITLLNTNLVATNTAIRSLVTAVDNDLTTTEGNVTTQTGRVDLLNTNLTSTNTAIRGLITTETGRVDLLNTNLTSTNTAIRGLISTDTARIDLLNTNLTATNTAIRTLVGEKLPLAGGTMTGAIDMGSNNITTTGKILFANMYSAESDLPSATTYHGMFAHVHGTGAAYYAHAGNWVKLANNSQIPSSIPSNLADLSNVASTSPTDGQALVWDNSASTWKPGTVAGYTYAEVTSNTTLQKDYRYIVDTSSTALTLTLPASATLGDELRITDGTGNASTYNITVNRNSHKIQGAAENLTVATNRASFGLVYYNTAQGWLLMEK